MNNPAQPLVIDAAGASGAPVERTSTHRSPPAPRVPVRLEAARLDAARKAERQRCRLALRASDLHARDVRIALDAISATAATEDVWPEGASGILYRVTDTGAGFRVELLPGVVGASGPDRARTLAYMRARLLVTAERLAIDAASEASK